MITQGVGPPMPPHSVTYHPPCTEHYRNHFLYSRREPMGFIFRRDVAKPTPLLDFAPLYVFHTINFVYLGSSFTLY